MSYDSLLRITCTIEVNTRSQNATTGEWTDSWANHATLVRCRRDMASGGEVRVPNDIRSKVTHVFYFHYRTDLDEFDYRIDVGGTKYNIIRISNAGGQDHHTEIFAELVKAGS